MSEFRVGITVRRARPEVASVMFDVNYLPAWLRGVEEVTITSGKPPELGAIVTIDKNDYEIVEFQHELTLVLQGEKRTLSLALEGVPVGTVAWLGIETERTGLSRLLSPILTRRNRRTAIDDLRRLKRFIESREYQTWWVETEPTEEQA